MSETSGEVSAITPYYKAAILEVVDAWYKISPKEGLAS